MFTDLAVIDWIALAFAAVLLAAACAAAVIAYATSTSRPGPLPPILKGRTRSHAAAHAMNDEPPTSEPSTADTPTTTTTSASPTSSPAAPAHAAIPDTEVDDMRAAPETVAVDDGDRRLAERAARLRGRPVPEQRPVVELQTVTHSRQPSLSHKATIQDVIANRVPAHAKSSSVTDLQSGVASSNFDRTEGFKARTPGFFDDPMGRHELRYWDGHTWTEYVKEHGERFTDPL